MSDLVVDVISYIDNPQFFALLQTSAKHQSNKMATEMKAKMLLNIIHANIQ